MRQPASQSGRINRPDGASPARPSTSRREQILDAAAALFARSGFHGVGIDEIGAAVGISGPALYRHFRSKDAMLEEMLTGISDKLLSGGRARVASTSRSEHALDELVRWHVEFALTNPALITVHLRDLDNLPTPENRKIRELQRGYVEVWVDVVRSVRPQLDVTTARAAVHATLGLINSTPHSAHLDTEAMSRLLHGMALAALTAASAGV